jgi:two-component system response regulator HydG
VKGAYTSADYPRDGYFSAANGGTLFLDELGRSTRALQRNLLEVVETGRLRPVGSDTEMAVDIRVIFATSVPMKDLVTRGRLLLEMYARIRTLTVRLPALRERPEDIPELAEFFLARHAVSHGYSKVPVFAREVIGTLCRAEWPLKVRELKSAIVALVIHAHPARTITIEHFRGEFLKEVLASAGRKRRRHGSAEVVRVFHAVNRNVSRTAEILGLERATVRSHLARSGLSEPARGSPRRANRRTIQPEQEPEPSA